MKPIKVSVAMATYNGEKYIKRQIESILDNLHSEDELIISDDGSTDRTIEIIKSFNDQRIKIFDGPQKGLNQNFANAIDHTSGDIIFICDQDDEWLPNKRDVIVKEFMNGEEVLIQHDAIVVDEHDEILFPSFAEHRNVKTGVLKNIIKNSYHGCCIAFRKSLKKEILPIPKNIYLYDQWLGLVAELNGKTKFIDDKLIKYKRHSENASSFSHLAIHQMIINRMKIIIKIVLYYIKRGALCIIFF